MLNNLGQALNQIRKPREAVDVLREAVRLKPGYAAAHSNLANVLQVLGRLDEAIAEQREAVRLEPTRRVPQQPRACLEAAGRPRRGVGPSMTRRSGSSPTSPPPQRPGLDPGGQGKVEAAIAERREAVRLEPDQAAFRNLLGAILCDKERDYDGAAAEFRAAIRLTPSEWGYHFNLGNALEGRGSLRRGVDAYREAIRLRGTSIGIDQNHGLAFVGKGDFKGAAAAYRRAAEHAPPGSPVAGLLRRGQAGRAAGSPSSTGSRRS